MAEIDEATRRWIRDASDERAAARGMRMDEARGLHAIEFAREHLRLYEGEWAGQPLEPTPWQIDFAMRLFGWVKWSDRWQRWVRRFRKARVFIPKKNGKALATDTPIATPSGWTTLAEIRRGDQVFDERGHVCRVIDVAPVLFGRPCYEVVFSDGERIVADAEHEWLVESYTSDYVPRVRETQALSRNFALRRKDGGEAWASNHRIRVVSGPLQTAETILPIDPYVLGVWLGDGDSDLGRFTCSTRDRDEMFSHPAAVGARVAEQPGSTRRGSVRATIDSVRASTGVSRLELAESLTGRLRRLGLLRAKRIPESYLRASVDQRVALLQGLMDTDGTCTPRGQCVFTTTSRPLMEGFVELARSLGLKPTTSAGRAKIDGRDCGDVWDVSFFAFEDRPVFRLERKRSRQKPRPSRAARSESRHIVSIRAVDSVPVRCISVDSPSRLFLAGRAMVPTHNSPTLAWIGLYLLAADGEQGNHVYFCAKDGQQARAIAGKHAIEMCNASPALKAECKINLTLMEIAHLPTKSNLLPLSSSNAANQKSKEGLNGSLLIDEVHVVDQEFMNRVSRAGISRSEPLDLGVSTAGDDPESYGFKEYERAKDVAEGKVDDDQFLSIIYEAPQDLSDDDLAADPLKYGRMANPNMGITVDEAEFLSDYHTSRGSLADLALFKMYRLNVWQRSASPWLRASDWDACGEDFSLHDFEGEDCWLSFDLSKTRDTTAIVATFRRDGLRFQWPFYFLPEETADELRDKVRYREWATEGHLELIDGRLVDYNRVRRKLNELHSRFNVRRVVYDGTYAAQMIQRMIEEDGWNVDVCQPFKQSMMEFAKPTKDYEDSVIAGTLRHPNNPLFTWQSGNVTVKTDEVGNKRPVKPKHGSIKTIDGVVAGIMSLAACDEDAGEGDELQTVLWG